MPSRETAPIGSPCWVDLWTSDVEGSRAFYSELFGWEALEPSPEFGGYFMFSREGVPIAGGMGDMGEMRADNTWKVYFATDDIADALRRAEANGAQVLLPTMTVADLGAQAVLIDPTGVTLGIWQPETFQGFQVIAELGAPSWFELLSPQYSAAVEFYRSTLQLETKVMSDTDEFRYTTLMANAGTDEAAGIMDASAFLPEGVPSQWSIYWDVASVDEGVARVKALGGAVVQDPESTPYGRLASVTDPAGAVFKLREAP
jgi:uncharacterized protein